MCQNLWYSKLKTRIIFYPPRMHFLHFWKYWIWISNMFDINCKKMWFFLHKQGVHKMSELPVSDFHNQMVGRPTSRLLLDTNLIPFQVSPFSPNWQFDSPHTFSSIQPVMLSLNNAALQIQLCIGYQKLGWLWRLTKHAGIAWVLLGGKRWDETKCKQFDKGSNF